MRVTVTILTVVAFVTVIYGVWLVLQGVNNDAIQAQWLDYVARGGTPKEWEDQAARYALMTEGERAMVAHGTQAESLKRGIAARRRGAVIAFAGALLGLAANLLSLWWR